MSIYCLGDVASDLFHKQHLAAVHENVMQKNAKAEVMHGWWTHAHYPDMERLWANFMNNRF